MISQATRALNHSSSTDSEPPVTCANHLIVAWRHGDTHAAEILCTRYLQPVQNAVRRVQPANLDHRFDEDDLMQSVFLALLVKLRELRRPFPNDSAFACWVWRFAKNKTAKRVSFEFAQCRTPKRETPMEYFDSNSSTSSHDEGYRETLLICRQSTTDRPPLESLILRESFARAAAQLPPKGRQVLELLQAGYPQKEIAAMLGVTARTIHRYKLLILHALGSNE